MCDFCRNYPGAIGKALFEIFDDAAREDRDVLMASEVVREAMVRAYELGRKAHISAENPQWTADEMRRMGFRPEKIYPINKIPSIEFTEAQRKQWKDIASRVYGFDLAKPGSDKSGVSVVRREGDKTFIDSFLWGENALDRAFVDAIVSGRGVVRVKQREEALSMSIPTVFEDEGVVGGPYSKIEDKPAAPESQPARINPAHDKRIDDMSDDEKKEARARIVAAMGWRE